MQRTTLLPLVDFISSRGQDPALMTVAELGCGTGRFHTFIKVPTTGAEWGKRRALIGDRCCFDGGPKRHNNSRCAAKMCIMLRAVLCSLSHRTTSQPSTR